MSTNDPSLAPLGEDVLSASKNPRLFAPEDLTRPLESIATADRLALVLDVDALGQSSLTTGDRALALALDALAQVGVQVVVVAKVAMDRAVALQRGVSRSSVLDAARAVPRLRDRDPRVRLIVVGNDPELLAPVGPEDIAVRLTALPTASLGVISGESSLRLVLWWLVARRATAGVAGCP